MVQVVLDRLELLLVLPGLVIPSHLLILEALVGLGLLGHPVDRPLQEVLDYLKTV